MGVSFVGPFGFRESREHFGAETRDPVPQTKTTVQWEVLGLTSWDFTGFALTQIF